MICCFQESSFPAPLPLGIISAIAKEWHPEQGMEVEKPLQPLAPVAPEMTLVHYFLFLSLCPHKGILDSSWLTRHREKGLPMSQLSM